MPDLAVYGQPSGQPSGWSAEPRARSSTIKAVGLDHDASVAATATRSNWPERLQELSYLAATSPATVYIESDSEETIHAHLNAVEAILRDPRPGLTKDIRRHRRRSSDGQKTVEAVKKTTRTDARLGEPVLEQEKGADHVAVLTQLQALLREVTLLNGEVERRREEAREIRDLFEERCRGLTRTVADLEEEVLELQSDLVEDAVDLECIQGTIHGLHDWIDRVREEQKSTRISRHPAYPKSRRPWISRKAKEDWDVGMDSEMMLEGLSAWMRGWRDVEEGFQVRARARQTRRDRRQEQLLRSGEKGESVQQIGISRDDTLDGSFVT